MARIVLTAVATGAAALLLHFHPWAPATQSQETYRAAVEPCVNFPSVPTPSQPPKPVEDSLPASSLVPPPVVSVSATCPQTPGPAGPTGPPTLPPLPPPSENDFLSVPPPPPVPPKMPGSAIPPQPTGGSPPIPLQVPQSPPPAPPTPSRERIRAKDQMPEPPPSAPPPPLSIGPPPLGPGPGPVTAVKPLTSPWSFHLEIVDGKNLITAKVGKTVQFRVVCEKLEIQSPVGSIHASGKVKITSQALEANCDRLTIQLHDEAVLLEGTAQMKCQHEGKELDLRSDSFSLKLSDIQGTTSKTATKEADPLLGASNNHSASPHTEAMRPPIITVNPGPVK